MARKLDPDEAKVRVRRYPCFGACECGINVTVWPDRLFYSRVVAADLPELFKYAKLAIFPVLTLAVVLRLRLSRERRFEVTPLDLLVIFVALALPNLPGLRGAPSNLGLSVAKLVVLFYALEMLAGHSARTKAWLWRSGAVFLAVLAVRGLVMASG